MARKDDAKSLGDRSGDPGVLPGLAPMIAPQMEQFWKAQDCVLEDAEAYSRAWFERRHVAAQSALDALRTAAGNGADPATAMQTMVEWQQQSVRRMADDLQQWVDLCTRCAARVTDAGMAASKESLGEVEARATSTASPKHATPV
jgi:hypothetical protein